MGEVLLDLVQGFLEVLFLVGFLEVAIIMVVEEEKDKRMVQTPSSLVPFLEDQEDATVVEEEDKHQEKINQERDSSGWRICLEEGTITAVIVPQHTTTTIMDTTVGTTMVITMGTIMGTMVEGAGPTLGGVSVTTD